MLDALPPLIGFDKPAIIRPATSDVLDFGMIPGAGRPRPPVRRPEFVGMSDIFTSDPANLLEVAVGPDVPKWVHFGVSWSAGANRTLDTVTFEGSPCARNVRALNSSAGSNIEWWSIETALPSGDLALDWSGSINGGIAAIFWSRRTGTLVTATGAFSDTGSGSSIPASCNAFEGGYILAGARWGTNPRSTTWTGADEVYDVANVDSFAMLPVTVAETGRVITATLSGAADFRRMAVLAVK